MCTHSMELEGVVQFVSAMQVRSNLHNCVERDQLLCTGVLETYKYTIIFI